MKQCLVKQQNRFLEVFVRSCNKGFTYLVTLLLIISVSGFAFGQSIGSGLSPEIRKQIHQNIPIRTIKYLPGDADMIWTLRDNPKATRIVRIEVEPVYLQTAQWDVLREWIYQGGTVWLLNYRGWLMPHSDNGKVVHFLKSVFNLKLGDGTSNGEIATASEEKHPLLTDVGKIPVDSATGLLLPINGVPLLLTSNGAIISALVPYGHGGLVIIPSFNESFSDGERFMVNLREFSAGYPVPKRK